MYAALGSGPLNAVANSTVVVTDVSVDGNFAQGMYSLPRILRRGSRVTAIKHSLPLARPSLKPHRLLLWI